MISKSRDIKNLIIKSDEFSGHNVNIMVDESFSMDAYISSLNLQSLEEKEDFYDKNPLLNLSISKIKKAGEKLRKKNGDLKDAIEIIQKYRTAHQPALNIISNIIDKSCENLELSSRPVTRLKRLNTIIDKLSRNPESPTCVTRMSDIGGARVVVDNLRTLDRLKNELIMMVECFDNLTIYKQYDYITHPKEHDCGYRSYHIIFEYISESNRKFKIETQLRTTLQHSWATTVEIVDLIAGTNIKTRSQIKNYRRTLSQQKWEHFFRKMSECIANLEQPDIHTLSDVAYELLCKDIYNSNEELHILGRLKAFEVVHLNKPSTELSYNVIIYMDKKPASTASFESESAAIASFNRLEQTFRKMENINVLFVPSSNFEMLEKYYPNYIGNAHVFIGILEPILAACSE